jgi:hypothetical protein
MESLADHHTARMLAQVARQILDGHVQIQKLRDQRILLGRKTGFAKLAFGGLLRVGPAPGGNQRRDARQIRLWKAQHFADVAHR